MTFELIVRHGEYAGRSFPIAEAERKTIGRAPNCEIGLPGIEGLSRYHCTVENREHQLQVTDLGSLNGTFIDGERVEEGVLRAGASLTFGHTTLECRPRSHPESSAHDDAMSTMIHDEAVTTMLRKIVDTQSAHLAPVARPGAALDELKRVQRNLATAYQVSKILARAHNLKGLFNGVIDTIFHVVDADRVGLLLQPSADASQPIETVAVRERHQTVAPTEISMSRTVLRDVLENGASILSKDAFTDARYQETESILRTQTRSMICVPVATDNRVIGLLYADNSRRPGAFGESELELLALVGNQAGLAIHRARLAEALQQSFLDAIGAIVAAVDAKDGYTHRHSERVSATAVRIGRELSRSEEELETLKLSGLLHDVGKIGVPDSILNKPGALDGAELREIKAHPIRGVQILSHIKDPTIREVLPGVHWHHEKWDGSGYPDGLAKQDIPWLGRIVAAADALDALSSDRSYRKGLSLDEAVTYILRGAGSHFDPEVAGAVNALHKRNALQPEV